MYAVPLHLLDKSGLVVVFVVILLVLITSCVFSISGASSILYYDVLETYIKVSDRCTGWRKHNVNICKIDKEICRLIFKSFLYAFTLKISLMQTFIKNYIILWKVGPNLVPLLSCTLAGHSDDHF